MKHLKSFDKGIKYERLTSGQHAGWWCASFGGLGVYAPTKDGAERQLKNVLYCAA